MTGKEFAILFLTLLGLPVIIPTVLMTFWIKCAINAGDNIYTLLIDTVDTEPVAVVEAIEDFKKRCEAANKTADNELTKKYPMSTPDDPECDYIDR